MSKRTALLVMDVQTGIIDRLPHKDTYVATLEKTVKGAREAGIKVIFVVVGFREGFPEISPNNKRFSAIKSSEYGPAMVNPLPAVTPESNEPVVTKKRVSAFCGSDLDVILRANEINELVLTGIATSGVVLSTIREAADKDYGLTVLSDLCWDADSEVNDVLINKVFANQAEVLESQTWLSNIS